MDGFLLESWRLVSTYTSKVRETFTSPKERRKLRQRVVTRKNIFCMIVLLFFYYECGSDEDFDSFFDFFSMLYRFSISSSFKDIFTSLGAAWLVWYVCALRYPQVYVETTYFLNYCLTAFNWLHMRIWVFYSLEDDGHEGRNPERRSRERLKRRLGIPRGLRPPILGESPQITPEPSPTGHSHYRSSSGASSVSWLGQRQGSAQSDDSQYSTGLSSFGGSEFGQMNGSGNNQNGAASGSQRGKGKKR